MRSLFELDLFDWFDCTGVCDFKGHWRGVAEKL
jgi:hypothetical protein